MTGMYARIVYVQNGSTLSFITAISAQEGNWRHSNADSYADDWVAVWNGSRDRAEEIKAEIKAFLANVLKLKLSEEKTLITHIDDGFQFWAIKFRVTNAGQMDSGCFLPIPAIPTQGNYPKHVHR